MRGLILGNIPALYTYAPIYKTFELGACLNTLRIGKLSLSLCLSFLKYYFISLSAARSRRFEKLVAFKVKTFAGVVYPVFSLFLQTMLHIDSERRYHHRPDLMTVRYHL